MYVWTNLSYWSVEDQSCGEDYKHRNIANDSWKDFCFMLTLNAHAEIFTEFIKISSQFFLADYLY